MAIAHIRQNTSQDLPCVNCGGAGNIIREGDNPRLKCTQCNFMYDADVSKEAKAKGAIPDGPPIPAHPESKNPRNPNSSPRGTDSDSTRQTPETAERSHVPRTPSFVFITKRRDRVEFCTKKDFKRTAIRWQLDGPHDVFELHSKQVEAKIEVK